MPDAGKTLVNTLAVRRMIVSLAVALTFALPPHAAAHDIPTDVRVNAFVKPDGQRLHLLIRVPLKAMRFSITTQKIQHSKIVIMVGKSMWRIL